MLRGSPCPLRRRESRDPRSSAHPNHLRNPLRPRTKSLCLVWWGSRKVEEQALAENEANFSRYKESPEGIELWGSIPGLYCSSTRTEIAGGIVALTGPGHVHQASDNLAFVLPANMYITNPMGKHRPFELMADGDLWAIYYKLLMQKGANAVKVTWVKAHTTEQQMLDGVTTANNRKGNASADVVADKGARRDHTQIA